MRKMVTDTFIWLHKMYGEDRNRCSTFPEWFFRASKTWGMLHSFWWNCFEWNSM